MKFEIFMLLFDGKPIPTIGPGDGIEQARKLSVPFLTWISPYINLICLEIAVLWKITKEAFPSGYDALRRRTDSIGPLKLIVVALINLVFLWAVYSLWASIQ